MFDDRTMACGLWLLSKLSSIAREFLIDSMSMEGGGGGVVVGGGGWWWWHAGPHISGY